MLLLDIFGQQLSDIRICQLEDANDNEHIPCAQMAHRHLQQTYILPIVGKICPIAIYKFYRKIFFNHWQYIQNKYISNRGAQCAKKWQTGPQKIAEPICHQIGKGPICQELGAPILLHHIGNAFFFVQSPYISPCILRPTIRKCIFDSDFSHAKQINYFSQTSNKQKLGNFTMKNKHPKTTNKLQNHFGGGGAKLLLFGLLRKSAKKEDCHGSH